MNERYSGKKLYHLIGKQKAFPFETYKGRMEEVMQIGIVGAGKVGTSLGKYIIVHGGSIAGYYSRTKERAKEAAQFTGTSYFETLDPLLEASDTLFLTVTDSEIAHVWDCIAAKDLAGKAVCHFSGSLSSEVFSNWEKTGAYVCSIHPIYAFSNKFTAYQNLSEAVFMVEGSKDALAKMQGLFGRLPNRILEIPTMQKELYHAALSVASNQVVGLVSMAVGMLKEAGIPEESAYQLLEPLVCNNVKAIFAPQEGAGCQGCAQALTGPIERGDLQTVRKHLGQIRRPEWEQAYRAAGNLAVQLAAQKNPGRDYTEIEDCLKASAGGKE